MSKATNKERRTKIIGTGSYLPPYVVDNEELTKIIGKKSTKWIESLLGIKERRYYSPINSLTGRAEKRTDELEMAEKAAKKAIQNAEIDIEQIAGLWYITCTQNPREHLHFSRAAIELSRRLELNEDTFVLEIDSGCGGVMQAVGVSNDMIKGDDKSTILVVASNAPSLFVDRKIYVATDTWLSVYIFGDGAGSVVLQKTTSEESGILATYYAASGNHPLMYFHRKNELDDELDFEGSIREYVYEIDAKAVKELFPVFMLKAIQGLKRKYNFSFEEVNRFYFHQANKRVLEGFAKYLEIPFDKVAVNVDRYGNLSAASTLVLMDEDLKEGRVKRGDLCLFCAVGAGTHYGAFLVKI